MRRILVPLLAAAALNAQELAPKPSANDYPVHATAGELSIGAQYHYRRLPARRGGFLIKDHLVIEVALYGPEGRRTEITPGLFTLSVNGKRALLAQPPPMILYQEENSGPTLVAGTGAGAIILGGPRPGPRFPGDPTVIRPMPAPAPRPENMPGESADGPSQSEIMKDTAFPINERVLPVAGYLYFPYGKKLQSIKKLELTYEGDGKPVTLRLK